MTILLQNICNSIAIIIVIIIDTTIDLIISFNNNEKQTAREEETYKNYNASYDKFYKFWIYNFSLRINILITICQIV